MDTTLRLRHRSGLAIAVAVALFLATAAVPVAAATSRWIVPAGTPLPAGSMVVGSFPVADALVVTGSTAPAGAVDFDAPVAMQMLPGAEYSYDDVSGNVDSGIAATNAPAVWTRGERGEQTVVALVDTGVADVAALQGAVAGEIDFTGTGGGDGFGHGTFMASVIAGVGPNAPGVAPEAGILSLKVGTADGDATLGSVVSALQWLHGPGASAGLRIATLAFGVDPDTDAAKILNHAADAVAKRGVLVITSTGNDGSMLSAPASAERTFSVGATNDTGDVQTYSGRGNDTAGVAQPDLYAPGDDIGGSLPEGSVIGAGANANADGMYHGSGTSMAAAVAAGVAALASSARPDVDGDALAAALRAGSTGTALDANAVVDSVLDDPHGKDVSAPPWVDDPAGHPSTNGKANGNDNGDEVDPDGLRWGGLRWGGLRWGAVRWTGLRWGGLRWGGLRWGGDHWGDESWAFGRWGGLRWGGQGWEGPQADPTAAGLRWTGLRWGGLRWGGLRWGGLRWGGLRWAMLEAPTA